MNFASKDEFRRFCKKRLKRKVRKKIYSNLGWLIENLEVKSVLLYLPMAHEPDTRQLIGRVRRKAQVYVPFMEGASFKMVKFRLPLKKKRFGIKEPPNSSFGGEVDLAVVPVLGVDGDFRRIGFGKGMYDRFFASLNRKPIVVFVQNRLCLTNEKLTESHDIQGDFLITPKEIIIRGDSDVGRDFSRKFCRHSKRRCRIFISKKNRKR
jgi:5-formyltetrahydrofolate cyclo-ligase